MASTKGFLEAKRDGPAGQEKILVGLIFLAATLLLPEAATVKVSTLGCVITGAMAIYYRLTLRPESTVLLSALSVILNTFAVGYSFSFTATVIASPIFSLAQSFLSLPFKVLQ